jgi:hypothetical protein
MRLYRSLTDGARWTINAVALVAVAISVTAFAIEHARLRMEREAARQRVCAADLKTLRATSAWAQKAFCSADDPCACVQIVSGGAR